MQVDLRLTRPTGSPVHFIVGRAVTMWRPLHAKHRVHGLGLGGMHSTLRWPTDDQRSLSVTRDSERPSYESELLKQQHKLTHDRRIQRALRRKLKERSEPYRPRSHPWRGEADEAEEAALRPSSRKRVRVTRAAEARQHQQQKRRRRTTTKQVQVRDTSYDDNNEVEEEEATMKAPSFVSSPLDVVVNEGETIRLPCIVSRSVESD